MSFLTRFFPVPAFLSMPAVGVDISDASVKYLALRRTARGIKLGAYGEERLAPGVVNAGGHIEKVSELAAVLSKIAQTHSFEHVALSLPEEQAYLVELSMPNMKESALRESIELSLEEYVPLPPAETIFDYRIAKYPVSEKEGYDLSLAALPLATVESYADVCKKSSLQPLSFEIEAHALARALVPRDFLGTYMIVDLGLTRSGVAIGSAESVLFSSTIPLGGDLITQAVAKALNIPKRDAEKLKAEKGLSRAKADEELFAALVPVLSALKDEIAKNVSFWQTHLDSRGKPHAAIQKIILCGGQAIMPGFADYLSSGLTAPVEIGNPWINIALETPIPEMPRALSLQYATAIGLAMRSFVS
jgi:type IV pilus assembly protein PilM